MNETHNTRLVVQTSAKRVRMSSHKVRKVVDQIRDCSCTKALLLLEFMPYRACSAIFRLIAAASTDANHRLGLDVRSLWISGARVDKGPTLKRMRPRAQGRGYPIHKPTCSVTLVVTEADRDGVYAKRQNKGTKGPRLRLDQRSKVARSAQ